MNIDVREYLRTNPISVHPVTISDNDLDCFLYFHGDDPSPLVKTQKQIFEQVYGSIFNALYDSDTGKLKATVSRDSIGGISIVWDSDAHISEGQFSKYIRRVEFDAFTDRIEGNASTSNTLVWLETRIDNQIKEMKSGALLDYEGAVEIQTDLANAIYGLYRDFKYQTGEIWCVQQGSVPNGGSDQVAITETINHSHTDTRAETMTSSLTSNRGGGSLVGEFSIGNQKMVASGSFPVSPISLDVMTPGESEPYSHIGDLSYPMWGENILDWRNPQRTHNNVPPSFNVFIRYKDTSRGAFVRLRPRRLDMVADTGKSAVEPQCDYATINDFEDYIDADLTPHDYLLRIIKEGDSICLYKQTVQNFIDILGNIGYRNLCQTLENTQVTVSMEEILKAKLDDELVMKNEFIVWYNGLLDRFRVIEEKIALIRELSISVPPRTYVGRIIISDNDDTEIKVIQKYGGKRWRRIVNFPRGVSLEDQFRYGVPRKELIGSRFGEEWVCLRESCIPNHTHNVTRSVSEDQDVISSNDRMEYGRGGSETKIVNASQEEQGAKSVSGVHNVNVDYQLSPLEYLNEEDNRHITLPHSNLPPYVEMYMWECVEITDEEKYEEEYCKVTWISGFGKEWYTYVRKGQTLGCPVPVQWEGHTHAGWFPSESGGERINSNAVINEDCTFYARWQVKTYTITWNGNGNGSTTTRTGIQYGTPLSDITPPTPEWNGHSTTGWYIEPVGGRKIQGTMKITSDVTFYAHWKSDYCIITFNGNGGSVNGGVETTILRRYGDVLGSLPVAYHEQTYGSIIFNGWYVEQNESIGNPITPQTPVTGNATYYAHYDRYIHYHRSCPDSHIIDDNRVISNFGPNDFIITKEPLIVQNNGTDQPFTLMFKFRTGTHDQMMLKYGSSVFGMMNGNSNAEFDVRGYPMESTSGQMRVYYKMIGPTLTDHTFGSHQIQDNTTYYVKIEYHPEAGTREIVCYISSDGTNWSEDASGVKKGDFITSRMVIGNDYDIQYRDRSYWRQGNIDLAESYIEIGQYRYHFKPEEKEIVNVTFNGNGGVSESQRKSMYVGEELGILPGATREGYSLDGWYTDSVSGSRINASTSVNEDVTFYAHWNMVEYTIRYNMNGHGTPIPNDHYNVGMLPFIPPHSPTDSNYTFLGWQPGGIQVGELGDKTFNAIWRTKYYLVTFYAEGGTFAPPPTALITWNSTGGSPVEDSYCVIGKSLMEGGGMNVLPTPTREYYSFEGWIDDDNNPVTTETVVDEDSTFYARWTGTGCRVVFDANGGEVDGAETKTFMVNYGETIANIPTAQYAQNDWAGSETVFLGWYTDRINGELVDENTRVRGDVTYYARWERFIHYTKTGNPTISSDGILSGISDSKYIYTVEPIDFSKDCDIVICAKTGTDVTTNQEALGISSLGQEVEIGVCDGCFAWEITGVRPWDSIYIKPETRVQCSTNTTYYFRIKKRGMTFKCYFRQNENDSWTLNYTEDREQNLANSALTLGTDIDAPEQYWRGTIDLSKSYVNIYGYTYKLKEAQT